MCGIAGIFDTVEQRPISEQLLQAMNDRQFHRGPDEGGIYRQPGVGLAHRRLSIIDIASGQQPMVTRNGQLAIVFNGEIYNFQALRRELQTLGFRFESQGDTEVILHAWQAWGPDCVQRLRGMFAFAIWDGAAETLFLARDRLGIKPLHYAFLPSGQLLFASELKSIMVHPGVRREFSPQAIEEYFALGYVPEPRTIYQQVAKLEPGFTLLMKRGRTVPQIRQYWDVDFSGAKLANEAEQQEALRSHLDEAVKIRLMSEVPLGAFLSGGVDSSSVVASMANQMGTAVKTCAIGFDVADFDETDYARKVARQYEADHLERVVASDDFDLLDKLADLYDEPYADSSAMPTYRVCQLAKERVTVCLSGDGGDEVFAGYRRYQWHMREEQVRGLLPYRVRAPLFGHLGAWYPKMDWAPRFLRAKSTLQGLARNSIEGYLHSVSLMTEAQRAALFSGDLRRQLGGYRANEVFERHAANFTGDDPLTLVQYLDMKTYLPGDILTKVDRASMAHALEVRVPLLDHKLVEWAATVPAELKLKQGQGKYLLKRAMASRLPNDVLYRRKMGFAIPLTRWFRGPLRERLRSGLLESELTRSGLFEPQTIERLIQEHTSGLREHSAPLWSLLMFASFLEQSKQTPRKVVDADTAPA